jgi:hypothetical protein
MGGNVLILEAFQIKFFKIFIALYSRLKFGISKLVIKGIQTLRVQKMVNPLAPFTAEKKLCVILLFSYHHFFGESEVTVGTCYLSQVYFLRGLQVRTVLPLYQ